MHNIACVIIQWEDHMSVFGSIMSAIFGHGSAQASASPTAAPSAPAQTVDVAEIVDKAAAAKGETGAGVVGTSGK